MKKLLLTIIPILFAITSFAQAPVVYKFIGNGNWSDEANWSNNIRPPSPLPDSSKIIINPLNGGECILDIPQTISSSNQLTILSGTFRVLGDILNYSNKGKVFINITDPRLAEIETDDGQRITFFGLRETDGAPKMMSGYSITSLSNPTKSDFVGLDNQGRYSNIFLHTGEKMHLEYILNDSVEITISGPDSVINPFNDRIATINTNNDFFESINIAGRMSGSDKNVNIKVVKKGSITDIEQDVKEEETVVIVRFIAGQGKDYLMQAQYNRDRGVYSVPLSSAGFNFNDNDAINKTVQIVKSTLQVACSKTNSGDPNVDKSILKLITLSVCPIPHPYAKAVCLAANTVLFACKAGKVLDVLNNAIYKIDANAIPPMDAAVTVSSQHYKYGTQYANQTSVSQILQNEGSYDVKITHVYPQKAPTVTTTAPTSITATSAISGGNITSDGGSPITNRGVCWSTSPNPTIANSKTTDGTGTGSFYSSITGLTANTTYYVRAYAINSIDTAYGNPISFITTNLTTILTGIGWRNSDIACFPDGHWSDACYNHYPANVYLTQDGSNVSGQYYIGYTTTYPITGTINETSLKLTSTYSDTSYNTHGQAVNVTTQTWNFNGTSTGNKVYSGIYTQKQDIVSLEEGGLNQSFTISGHFEIKF